MFVTHYIIWKNWAADSRHVSWCPYIQGAHCTIGVPCNLPTFSLCIPLSIVIVVPTATLVYWVSLSKNKNKRGNQTRKPGSATERLHVIILTHSILSMSVDHNETRLKKKLPSRPGYFVTYVD